MNVLHSSSRASSRSRSSQSAELVVEIDVVVAGKEALGLQLDKGGGDEQELGGDVEIELLEAGQLVEVGVDDRGELHLVEVDLFAQDQVQQQVERALEHGRLDLVRHGCQGYWRPDTCPRMVIGAVRSSDGQGVLRDAATGDATLGSLLGALRNWVDDQNPDALYCVVDLHALTVPQDPVELRRQTLELATLFLAVGLDPEVCTLFVQSHVHEHTELAWLLECTVAYGELRRMTQFKDKRERAEFVSAGLFTYPALMAADILLYDTEEVPVGDDQRQHVELTRDVAERFNSRYGPTFTVPKATIRAAGARVMDLQDPTSQDVEVRRRRRGHDPRPRGSRLGRRRRSSGRSPTRTSRFASTRANKPGVSNLLSILGACTGESPDAVASRYTQYGPLKNDAADAVAGVLGPIQDRYRELASDPSTVGEDPRTRCREGTGDGVGDLRASTPQHRPAASRRELNRSRFSRRRRPSAPPRPAGRSSTIAADRWCSRVHASVSGSLPAIASRSPPRSGCSR